ncbi:MAG TPA: NrfD/PsrC family molybdoenzyme membrane anchor subunit [Anaerolineae bacterium]|nr:NrfD/PsrC family molybdoenzyme membrane anchor subunit [Anaerolineae bacterium]
MCNAADAHVAPAEPAPILEPGYTPASVVDEVVSIPLARHAPSAWYIGFAASFALLMLFLFAITYLVVRGVGIWGVMIPVAWGVAIVTFVWWIGIAHASSLVVAALLVLRQEWRVSISRLADALTLFALACAGLFPILHLGRPWFFYWLLPYPNTMDVWPQFRSPLVWDLFAILAHGLVAVLFWYLGLIPDLATMRDRASDKLRAGVFRLLALGWHGSSRNWFHYRKAYYLIAATFVPLVVWVQSVVGLDFATTIVPGWHVTTFPAFFVAGALFSGLAMVLAVTIPVRGLFRLHGMITQRQLDNLAKLLLASALGVAYGYLMEYFMAWYSGSEFEIYTNLNRALGPYAPLYWLMLVLTLVVVQAFWFRRVRLNAWALFAIALLIITGRWLERFVLVVSSLHRDYLVSAWAVYVPTIWDWATLLGSIGLFLTLLFLFLRLLPMISIFEMRELLARKEGRL